MREQQEGEITEGKTFGSDGYVHHLDFGDGLRRQNRYFDVCVKIYKIVYLIYVCCISTFHNSSRKTKGGREGNGGKEERRGGRKREGGREGRRKGGREVGYMD